ncbi:hypothetical protein WDW37_17715 [Bdellovibrionota bacterium FG-1]
MAIIALLSAMAIPGISSYFQVSLNTTSREIAGTIKETYNATVTTGRVYRLVFDLKEGNYWVESGPPNVLLDTKESKEKEERKKRMTLDSDKKEESPFQMDKTVTRKKHPLPTGVSFEDVITQQSFEPITDGLAYAHFFPHGIIEQTLIHLKDESKHHMTLVISPVIGKTELYERYINSQEAFGDK